MSNHYAIGLLVEQHHAELRNEAAQDSTGTPRPVRTVAVAPAGGSG